VPFDEWVAAARLAHAAVLVRQGDAASARPLVERALTDLVAYQRPRRVAKQASAVDDDVAAIRALLFRPTGDLPLLRTEGWSAFTFPDVLPRFVILPAEVTVTEAGGDAWKRAVYQPLPGLPDAIFLAEELRNLLARIPGVVGGTATRERTGVMDTFNQPIGTSVEIARLWGEFFPLRPGHWGGWEFETYPQIGQVEFVDASRTRARIGITIGYSGATVILEKVNGVWRALRLTDWWIT
jgi:hypothetical protein